MKTELTQLRMTPDEKRAFQEAARLAGISLSAWVRERLRLAAIRELESAGLPVPFVPKQVSRDWPTDADRDCVSALVREGGTWRANLH